MATVLTPILAVSGVFVPTRGAIREGRVLALFK